MARVEFLVQPNDSIWTRDYGPWFVFDGTDQLTIIDHVYNRSFRPNDNLIPIHFGAQQGIPVVSHDMYHTGGNYMTDGANISSSTFLVYAEASGHNAMSPTEVDQLMLDYYGVTAYEVLDYIESGGIHHIDTWAKFLDEETVLVKEVWPSHHTYAALEQRATLLASLPASTGRNYQVHRVYCHDFGGGTPASYTNSLILNRSIYVPTFGNATRDTDALDAYMAAMPGYIVRGYAGGWLTDDALHCRAKGVMDADMLRVAHIPICDEQAGQVIVSATIKDHSGLGLSLTEVSYRQNGSIWTVTPMTAVGGDLFEAVIPAPLADVTTDYLIHAEALSGRAAGMPRAEPAGWYSFNHRVGTTALAETAVPAATAATLHAARPNPLSARTTFSFELLHEDEVELDVFDAQGRLVRRLLHGTRPAGVTEIEWDGDDQRGRPVAAGVYYYRLRAAGIQYSRPVLVVK